MTAPRDAGGDVALVRDASVFAVVVATAGVDAGGTARRASTHAADRRDGLDQRNPLGNVVTIRAGRDCCDRRSVGVDGDVVLRPGRARLVGFGPVFRPPQPHESTMSRRPRGRSRSSRLHAVSPAALRAVDPTRRFAANRATCANNLHLCRIPFRTASRANECPSSAQIGCPSKPRGPLPACGRDT